MSPFVVEVIILACRVTIAPHGSAGPRDAHSVTDTIASKPTQKPRVPTIPPDSLPADVSDTTKWVRGEPHYAGLIVRDMVVLVFRRGASQADRQAAIDLVNGTVVGGRPFSGDDGVYLVRIPGDGTNEPLFKALGKLRVLPQVSIAMPEDIIIGTGELRTKRP